MNNSVSTEKKAKRQAIKDMMKENINTTLLVATTVLSNPFGFESINDFVNNIN